MRVLIAGCGDVGQALARLLVAQGHRVWGVRRSAAPLPEGVEAIRADLTQPAALAALPAQLDVVVYAASADARDDDAYRRAYVDGPRSLIAALVAQGQSPRRVVFTSSTGVYHQTGGEWVDESSPTRPREATGRRLLEGEQVVLGGPFAATVVRFGGIYGPGRTWLLDRVAQGRVSLPPRGETPEVPSTEPATARRVSPPTTDVPWTGGGRARRGPLERSRAKRGERSESRGGASPASPVRGGGTPPEIRFTNRIHRDDCAGVLRHLIELPDPDRLYLGVDDEPAPLREVVSFLAERMGVDLLAGQAASPPPGRRSNKRCTNARLRSTGYSFTYPSFREGYPDLIERWLATRPA